VRAWSLASSVLLLLSILMAQADPALPGQRREVLPAVAPGDPVITVHGFCADEPASTSDACETVVTRAEFDKLAEALSPDMPRSLRLKVASAYVRMMRMAAAAEARGLDKTAAFAEELRYARLQLLSQDLTRVLQAEAHHLFESQIVDYYNLHQQEFERATLERIFVPGATADSATGGRAGSAQLAGELRRRAAGGESPRALQVEAFRAAGMEGAEPQVEMANVSRESLPLTHANVMDLRPGEVSEVLSDPGGGAFIYKMITKANPPLSALEPQIRERLASERYRESLERFTGDVVFNDAYFDPPQGRGASASRARRRHGTPRESTPEGGLDRQAARDPEHP
jgi:hypothetical protein